MKAFSFLIHRTNYRTTPPTPPTLIKHQSGSAAIVGVHLTGISNQSKEDELSGQICSAELASNQLLFVDMNQCISLTGNKLLYPARREAISPAPVGFRRRGSTIYSEHFPFDAFSVRSCKKESSPGPQVPAAAATTSNNNRKNRGGRSTACELVMIR